MSNLSSKKESKKSEGNKVNYVVKILNNIDEVNNILKTNNYLLQSYKYDLEIYMVNKNEDFAKIKKLKDINDYAIIKDENGNRKIILNQGSYNEAKLYSIFLAYDLLYNLGYYKLFYVNQDIYYYETSFKEKQFYFEILDVKEQGCYLKVLDITLNTLKNFINKLKEVGIKIDEKNLKVDIIQQALDKVVFKKK